MRIVDRRLPPGFGLCEVAGEAARPHQLDQGPFASCLCWPFDVDSHAFYGSTR